MKNKILILLFTILGITSCQKVLDVAPDGRKSLDQIFANDATTSAYLNSCYKNFPLWGTTNWWNTNNRIAYSDDSWDWGPDVVPFYQGSATTAAPIQEDEGGGQSGWDNSIGFWNKHWQNIRSCNIFLSRIASATVTSEADRNRWTAEAKALRAFYNLELIKRYGGMPIVASPIGIDYDYKQLKREPFKACADNIIKDCNEALATPEFPWRITAGNEAFRFTKAIAAFVKSSAILFAASDLWNGGQNYWAEAETVTKKSLDDCLANGYELYNKVSNPSIFQSAYQEYFCSVVDWSATPVDKESILASRQLTASWIDVEGMPLQSANEAGMCPSQELIDAYGMKTTGQTILQLDKPYLDDAHLQPNYKPGSGYDPANPYVGRDPRFYATVYYNGAQRKNLAGVLTDVQTYYTGNCGIDANDHKQKTGTGYYIKKYDHPSSIKSSVIPTSYRVMRLAELYLNYAEAANENGNLSGAVGAVNAIRARAGMPNINPAGKDEARLLIRNERRVELAYEENRYFDVRRWTKPDGDLSATDHYITGVWIIKTGATFDYKRFVIGDSWNITTGAWTNTAMPRACYTNKFLIWPIQLSESQRLEAATDAKWQNPGW